MMCSSDCSEKTLINLKVISAIPCRGKLTTHNDNLQLDPPRMFRPIYRMFYREDRTKTFRILCSTITTSISYLNNALNVEIKNRDTDESNLFSRALLRASHNELHNCLIGLKNLKESYETDMRYVAQLSRLEEQIRDSLQNFEECIQKFNLSIPLQNRGLVNMSPGLHGLNGCSSPNDTMV